MLVISRLQPRNSESKWVGVLCEIQNGAIFLPLLVYSIGVVFRIAWGAPMLVILGTQTISFQYGFFLLI